MHCERPNQNSALLFQHLCTPAGFFVAALAIIVRGANIVLVVLDPQVVLDSKRHTVKYAQWLPLSVSLRRGLGRLPYKLHLGLHEGGRVRRALRDISADEGQQAFYDIQWCECAARVPVVEIFDRVESARRRVLQRCAQVGLVCEIRRSFVVRLRQRYHRRVVARIDAVELRALPQGAEAGIAPKNSWY